MKTKKYVFLFLLGIQVALISRSQDTPFINRLYFYPQKGEWSLHFDPLSWPTLRYNLVAQPSFNGRLVIPTWAYRIGVQTVVSSNFALGVMLKYQPLTINNSTLFNYATNNYTVTNLTAQSLSTLVYGRYYYNFLNKPSSNPRRRKRQTDGNHEFKARIFSGIGVGYGFINWKASVAGKYDYYQIPLLENFIYSIEILGVDLAFSKHFFVSSSYAPIGAIGIVLAIAYKF